MKSTRVVLIGGSGFVGSVIANRLSAAAIDLCIPTRRPARAAHLLPLPTAQILEADVHDPVTLARLLEGADAVVNLVGILHSRPGSPYGRDFARAHVELPRKLVSACRSAGVRQLIHISALGANPDGPSEYQRSKAAGEAEIHAAGDDVMWTVLRPSVIFGRADRFLNLFADLARTLPVLPLAGARTRFQPVYVEDVAEVVWRCLGDPACARETFEVAGPTVYTLRELVEYVSALAGHPRPVIALPEGVAMLQARLMSLLPQPLISPDNIRSMRVDNVASGAPLPFGLRPTAVEEAAPEWIAPRVSPRAHFDEFRRRASRPRG
ncbi:complex I NDUFA9 subunit family protein [Azoarcus olearius]|uniref:NADH dehydrogenase n=1 Tax=Azoarcus sp. (strain BH72) TaxID=418699 RepID=A1K2Q7_AZOSB|nr:complex I NDUFA9 subunit family protein [Azoarcus olearius]CAL93112.1 putative NADH dehydrogenase [Azoarcus olearius]